MNLREEIIKEIYNAESKSDKGKEIADKLEIVGYTVDELTKEVIEEYTDIAVKVIEKRIDSEINEIQKSIDSFTPECGYAMVNQSQQKIAIEILNHVKEMLKK